ncbi:PREDICTED: rapamycin-insensitive companion of mTOR [Papilio polytes]|uniref:rapamycin-insensitive companion of mTOR n=1 Tax=Papilio polytes TaxID=76194 RepID=UPI00067651F6|nr:PREDICTED: rapamycin-insensitive companion of mTOR [Papilio polytes]
MMATYENWSGRRRGKQGGDLYRLDTKNKSPEENIKEIIQGLYLKKTFNNDTSPTNKNMPMDFKTGLRNVQKNGSDSYRHSCLNALVVLLSKEDRNNLGFSTDELMTCIRASLVDESMVIRAAALRALRYLIKTESDVATFNILKLTHIVTRSMDLMLRNEEERAQALRVVRRVIAVVGAAEQPLRCHRSAYIDQGLLRCLTAVARAGSAGDGTGDRLSRPAVATLAEICVLNPDLFISCGGVNAVIRQLAECATPRMAEALCGVLLHTLNEPLPRRAARIDLTCLNSPYCDFHCRPAGTDSNRDEREMRFTCSRLSLLCVLRSWPGLLHFCNPCSKGGLRALVSALYLPRLEVRKAILDLLYELVGLPQPEWTDEISVALDAVDPSDFQDSWRLNEGFVAAEGTAILPHLSATGPDIIEIHLALLLQCFLEAGLLDGLAEVIVTSDTFISVRATVLLGQLLHLIHMFLPPQICNLTPALPTLLSQASAGKPQALAAVAALRRLHSMLEARPASNSLFLDHIIQYCSGAFRHKIEDMTKSRKEKDNANMAKPHHELLVHKESSIEFLNESDNENEPKQRHSVGSRADVTSRNVSALVKSKSVSSRTSSVGKVSKSAKFFSLFERDSDSWIRSSLVMQSKDGNTWDWEIIRTILKESDGAPLLNLNDSGHKAWASRIISYLKPSSNKYSHTDLSTTSNGHSATRAGCQLIRHLLQHNDADSQRMLEELFMDVSKQIEAIETGRKAHECLFSPQHMCNTMCQMYFLFIGQLCHSQVGLKLFKQTGLYDNLLELSTKTHHSCYVKLVISSLDYTLDSSPRDVLAKTLTCTIQASRLYATQFLNVLLRASRSSRELVRKKSKLKKNYTQDQWKHVYRDDGDSNAVDMDTWVLQMLVGQVKDESKKVVKCALSILEEAYSVPAFLEKLMTMKDTLGQNCRLDRNADPSTLDFSSVGDRGYLIWLGLEVAATVQTGDTQSIAFLKRHLDFWAKSYNYRYVRLVEAGVHEALSVCEGVRRPRASRRAVRTPPHLLAALAAAHPAHAPHPTHAAHPAHPANMAAVQLRGLLAAALPPHYKVIQGRKCSTEQEIMELKASLWAVGSAALSGAGLRQVAAGDAPRLVVRLATSTPVYSVRATAFYVLGLFATTFEGANILSDLGWISVRHTRHDQFPIIPDESYPPSCDPTIDGNYITSPERRYNAFDIELSEHSDHTDLSTAESVHSDTKHGSKTIIDHDVDFKTPYNESRREVSKRKSHTLPTQGCSTSHDRPALTESRTVDILRDCSSYERPGPHRHFENRLLLGRMNSLEHHEGRVRNTSESSTSGVSSCDSAGGKYAIPDRILTLSPIPSSSSLYGMKSSSSSHRPRMSESQRRTSTSSFSTCEVASSPPTQMDMSGYATLKTINKHRRPHLSESAASGSSELEELTWLLTDTQRRSKPFSSLRDRAKSTRERMTKLSLLDYDWKPLPLSEGGRTSPPPAARDTPRRAPHPAHPPHPAQPPHPTYPAHPPPYIGICLPKDLKELFPKDEEDKEDSEMEKRVPFGRTGVNLFPAEYSNTSTENKSRNTPEHHAVLHKDMATSVPASIPRTTEGNVTTAGNTDTSFETHEDIKIPKQETKNIVKIDSGKTYDDIKVDKTLNLDKIQERSTENLNVTKTDNIEKVSSPDHVLKSFPGSVPKSANLLDKVATRVRSPEKTGSALDSSISEKVNVKAGLGSRWRHSTNDCLACVKTRPPSSHELREAFFAAMESPSNSVPPDVRSRSVSPASDTLCPQAEVLHHVHFMSNPIHLKQARSTLISLKQRYPEVFRSPCVYSDVCALLARDTYMLCARRFLQELFLDVNFDCFAHEPIKVLSRHGAILSPTQVKP